MSNLQVKHVDAELHEALRQRAAAADRTISEYVLELIRRDLRRPNRHEWLRRTATLTATGRTSAEIHEILAAGRRDTSS